MWYQYKCKNEKCKEFNIIKDISLPMSESDKPQFCKECKQELQKVFGVSSIKTGDGLKC